MARSSECTEQYAQKVFDRDPHCQRSACYAWQRKRLPRKYQREESRWGLRALP
jgi:hypothetical protein